MKTTNKNYTLFILPKNAGYSFNEYNSNNLEYLKRKYKEFFYTGKDLNTNNFNFDYIIKDNYNNSYLDFNHTLDSDYNYYYNQRIKNYKN